MVFSKKALFLSSIGVLMAAPVNAAVDSTFHCYLLFGQSNMAGGGAGVPLGGNSGTLIGADCDTSPRVKALAFCDCAPGVSGAACSYSTSRTEDTWYTAHPALHICNEGVSPGDWFAKTMLDSIRSDIKIGLIPCALSGQALKVFVKGNSNFAIPTWAHPTLGNNSPYAWMLAKCIRAQQTGVIKGFLLHQGESGSGVTSPSWIAMARGIFDSLKKDLGLASFFPIVVGELRKDAAACCAGFNTNIDSLAKVYPNCGLASSAGLTAQSDDPYHFDPAGMRELGRRYALALLAMSSSSYIPRRGSTAALPERAVMYQAMKSARGGIIVYSINGRIIRSYASTNAGNAFRDLKAGGVFLVSRILNDGRKIAIPFFKE